jgi:hypothetical protein
MKTRRKSKSSAIAEDALMGNKMGADIMGDVMRKENLKKH